MELPRQVLVGNGVLDNVGGFAADLGIDRSILAVTGPHVKHYIESRLDTSLQHKQIRAHWSTVSAATIEEVNNVTALAKEKQVNAILGVGGGKSVDCAKLAAHNLGRAFLSIPTSASHDGISSPFASIKGLNKPYSFVARSPIGILADIDVIANAPRRLLISGCGDLIAKVTAVRDWELGRDEKGEYFGRYSANLALLSANIIVEAAQDIGTGSRQSVRDVVEALISAGVAAGIAGSSRPCSGAEHLFSHALESLAPGVGLHGEKCGLGTILMAKLHGLDWTRIRDALKKIGAPTQAAQLGLTRETVVEALLLAPNIRPERFTILNKRPLTRSEALNLAQSTGVL